jgi:hypothetical protein
MMVFPPDYCKDSQRRQGIHHRLFAQITNILA